MLGFLARRAAASIGLLLLSSVVVFVVVAGTFDPLAALRTRRPAPPASTLAHAAERLGLDRPLPARYADWLVGVLHGDLGTSVQGLDIRADLARRLVSTTVLVLPAVLLGVGLALVVGTVGAARRYRPVDHALTAATVLVLSVPVAWLAGNAREAALRANDLTGAGLLVVGDATTGLEGGLLTQLGDRGRHAVVPVLVLATFLAAAWSRIHRAATVSALTAEHVRAVRALGVPPRRILRRHVLRTACVPLATVVALDVGAVLGGTVVVEQAFGWHGLGEMLVDSVAAQDVNRLLAWLMVSASAVVLSNLVADVVVAVLDPRTRRAG